MSLVTQLTEKLKGSPPTVVFPEGEDPRILQAARQLITAGVIQPVLLGDRALIKQNARKLDIQLEGIRMMEPLRSEKLNFYVDMMRAYERFSDYEDKQLKSLVTNNSYFATLMLMNNEVDALVGGATISASNTLRPLFQLVPFIVGVQTISSMMMVESDDYRIGGNETLFLADCAVIPEPTIEQLADIAITTALFSHHLTNQRPRVAMLSYSTKSSFSKNPTVNKMKSATITAQKKAKDLGLNIDIDGEMQVDTAIDASTAKIKNIDSSVAGRSNVLVFPDLHSANISSKLIQVVGGVRSYGQLLTGLTKPAAEISRGASAHEIYGTSIIVASQAIDKTSLHPNIIDE